VDPDATKADTIPASLSKKAPVPVDLSKKLIRVRVPAASPDASQPRQDVAAATGTISVPVVVPPRRKAQARPAL